LGSMSAVGHFADVPPCPPDVRYRGLSGNRDAPRTPQGQAIVIDGLWSLRVGSNAAGSANFGPNTVFFTAGPNGEQDGLFGAITSSP
jgi:hypothetical protein